MSEISHITLRLSIWWQEAIEGDKKAFSNIHKELFNGLYYYAVKLLGDSNLANDTLQELFIKLWVKRKSIGELKNVKAYFFTSLRRQLLNELRNIRSHSNKISSSSENDFSEINIADDFDIEFSPEEIIIKNQESETLHEKLMDLLNELPRRQKEVIYLHYFEEMSYDQIANIMGINYQSVLNHVQKALQKLREQNLLILFLSASSLTYFLRG